MNAIKTNLIILKGTITALEQRYHRKPGSITLLAVSKTQSIEKIKEAIKAGQHCFGENYVQEALPKIKALKDQHIEWHFIGPIQANKTKAIAENFSWVHSVDRLKIAQRLNDQRPQQLPPLNVCIEVNISNETTKAGISINELPNLAAQIQELPKLKLRGLMAIPEITNNFEQQRSAFQQVATALNNLDTLSMGMSGDYEAAIAAGATIIRIGTAIFGARNAT